MLSLYREKKKKQHRDLCLSLIFQELITLIRSFISARLSGNV